MNDIASCCIHSKNSSYLLWQCVNKGRVPEKKTFFLWSFAKPPLGPPPGKVFLRIKKLPQFFLSEIRSQMGETNFTFDPIPKIYFFVL